MTKQTLLDAIAADIVANKVCPELASQATQLVMGTGNPNADIVLIGEAPGKREDEQGEPFVGASGKFLNEMLESIHLNRSQIYITNIVKYRPPKNRDPLPEEKKQFTPYLERQLEVIKPKIVITLGRHSGEYFLPEIKISRDHGEPKRMKIHIGRTKIEDRGTKSKIAKAETEIEFILLPLYHPAAALYNGSMRQTLLFDFAKIPIILKKLNTK